ncbi:MAG TPA: preprotein translocase subunit SecE [Candidatus Paceibacterota bacterium]|jgi:preprotein translocase SecE subunit|nr:preprotein translocase subunit SecE [Candidatus Paceibacterota bacterium]
MKNFISYLKNVRAEMSHVVWPNTRVAIGHVGLIILISVITAALVAGLDYVFTQGVSYVLTGTFS